MKVLFSVFPGHQKFLDPKLHLPRKRAPVTKYTPQETETLLHLYNSGVSIEELAQTLNKSSKSVVAKLSRMEVYAGVDPKPRRKTKSELVEGLENRLTLSRGSLASMTKMDREEIVHLVECLSQPQMP